MDNPFKNTNELLGLIVREWRHKKSLSLEELSRNTGGAVSARHLRRIEAGECSATYETFFHIRGGMNMTTTEMFMPYFIYENQIPLYSAQPVPKSALLKVGFTPGITKNKYPLMEDPGVYAICLEEDFGFLAKGTLLEMSPLAPLEEGSLVLGLRSDGMVRVFRLEAAPEKVRKDDYQFIHRIVLIEPK